MIIWEMCQTTASVGAETMPKLEDELQLGADGYLRNLLKRKSFLDHVWVGVKFTCLLLSLFLSVYSIYLTRSVDMRSTLQEIQVLRSKISQDEHVETSQLASLAALNKTLNYLVKIADSRLKWREVVFDCYRTSKLTRPTIVNYDGCFVDTTNGSMDVLSGIFTVADPGIYQLTFTAKYVSSNRGRFGAWSDIYVNRTVIVDSQREYNGPTETNGNLGLGNRSAMSESSTHSVFVIYPLGKNDQVKVQFNRDGTSYIHSDNDHDVHFTGRRLAPLGPE